jgi:hypothetical protein
MFLHKRVVYWADQDTETDEPGGGGAPADTGNETFKTPWGEEVTKAELEAVKNDKAWRSKNDQRSAELKRAEREAETLRKSLEEREAKISEQIEQGVQKGISAWESKLLEEDEGERARESTRNSIRDLYDSDPIRATEELIRNAITEQQKGQPNPTESPQYKEQGQRLEQLEKALDAIRGNELQRVAATIAKEQELGEQGQHIVLAFANVYANAKAQQTGEDVPLTEDTMREAVQCLRDEFAAPIAQQQQQAGADKVRSESASGGAPAPPANAPPADEKQTDELDFDASPFNDREAAVRDFRSHMGGLEEPA